VLALQDEDGRTRVYALPITHSPPEAGEDAIEIPAAIKARLKLDGERSWPGPDLRFVTGMGPESAAYGFLPPGFFRVGRDRFLAGDRKNKPSLVARTE
jgi:hypothetical protein